MSPRLILSSLVCLSLFSACTSNPPLSPEEKAQRQVAEDQAIAYFSKRIEVTDKGGANIPISELELVEENGQHLVKYYRRDETFPYMQHKVSYCERRPEAPMRLFCSLDDGQHKWAQLTFERVEQDKVVKDNRVLGFRSPIPIKQGQLHLYLRLSPLHWDFAARFKDQPGQ